MAVLIGLKSLILVLFVLRIGFCEEARKIKFPFKRSYQTALPVVNDAQGFQYYSTGQLFTAVPAFLVPNQNVVLPARITSVVMPQQEDFSQNFAETSTLVPSNLKANKPAAHYRIQNNRISGPSYKRPSSFLNFVHGHPGSKVKALYSSQNYKDAAISPQYGLLNYDYQGTSSTFHPNTHVPPVRPTYGPAKVVDIPQKHGIPGSDLQTVYRQFKGPSHRHSPKTVRVYTHTHKGHLHSHHFPVKQLSASKPFSPVKYSNANYLTATVEPAQETSESFPYQTDNAVGFPDERNIGQNLLNTRASSGPAGVITRAIIKNPGHISNYDATIPLQIPTKKPFRFQVNDIHKGSDVHFLQESQGSEKLRFSDDQSDGYVQYSNANTQQNSHSYGSNFAANEQVDQSNPVSMTGIPSEFYKYRPLASYQDSNHLVPDHDLGSTASVKIPVAVIKGTHQIGMPTKRKYHDSSENGKNDFTPSKSISGWIPMTAYGAALSSGPTNDPTLDTSDDRIIMATNDNSKSSVEEIISGKIPVQFSPNPKFQDESNIITGKIPFLKSSTSDRAGRKGTVISVPASAASGTSDLVVSSVIKFS